MMKVVCATTIKAMPPPTPACRHRASRLVATLPGYARAVEVVAEADLDCVTKNLDSGPATAAQTVVVGTVLGDALLAGLRRMAQESESHRRFGPTPGSPA